MNHVKTHAARVVMLLLLFVGIVPTVYAAGADAAPAFNMAIAYGFTSAAALLLAVGYWSFVKKKHTWLQLLFVSVFIINCGYFALAISKTLPEALLANRISYLGSVFLPLCMLMTILDVCRVSYSKKVPALLLLLSIAVFLLAASPGYLDCYYRDVSLTFINGMAKLEKVYGPLHSIYLIYLLTYMGLMAGVILHSRIKRKVVSHKHAILLMVVTLLNMVIWGVEQLIYTEFELLSVSYIVSEFLLLVLCGKMQDHSIPADNSKEESAVTEGAGASHTALDADRILFLSEKWAPEYTLTTRETQVLVALLQNKRHQEIADDINVSEHTVRKHTDSIFSKMEISGHADLFALAARS